MIDAAKQSNQEIQIKIFIKYFRLFLSEEDEKT